MSKPKLIKFSEYTAFPNTYDIQDAETTKGNWQAIFGNNNPIVIELACGKGDYTVGLARLNPDINYVGVDIKSNRMWTGAKAAITENLSNVRFLRTHIDNITEYFAPNEVHEIWISAELEGDPGVADIVEIAAARRVPLLHVARARLEREARSEAPQGVLAHAAEIPEADVSTTVALPASATAGVIVTATVTFANLGTSTAAEVTGNDPFHTDYRRRRFQATDLPFDITTVRGMTWTME